MAAGHPKFKAIIGFGAIIDLIIIDQITKWLILEYVLRPAKGAGEPLGLFDWFDFQTHLDQNLAYKHCC